MFKYNGTYFSTLTEATTAVMLAHPELLDDNISDYVDSHVEDVTMDTNIAAQEISDFTAEQGELGQERMELLHELATQDERDADSTDLLADSDFNPVDSGVFDDDPSPYSGDYSEE
jgi:hypothetical protein